MQHLISYDLARGLHVIAIIAWMAGLLMLPRFYASITVTPKGDAAETILLDAATHVRRFILLPAIVFSWAFGLFLLVSYLVPDPDLPAQEWLPLVPPFFWPKLVLVLALSAYHGFLVGQGRRLAKGERRYSDRFWRIMSIAPFVVAAIVVLLATVES